MIVAVDVDGPLYEWDRTAQYMLRTYRGADVHAPSVSWDWIEERVSKADWDWLWSEGVKLGLFRHGHVTTNAIVSINRLKALGHSIVIVTHRPESAVRDTINWLDHHFGAEEPYPLSNVHILTHGEPKTSIRADVLVDDKPTNVVAWYARWGQAILFDRPHNQGYEGPWDRAKSWDEVVSIIDRMSAA